MQKGANRILGALIVLVMALSILSAAVFATGETAKVLEGWSITLSDDIGVKFHLDSEGYTVTATVNGTEVTPTVSGKVVTVNVSAAQMTAPIVLTVKNGTETVYNGEYSVREYAETVLEGSYDVYVKDMVKKMLNYGAAAQTYFDYNTTNLANAGYELEPAGDIPTDAPAPTVRDNLGGIELYGMSLVLRNKLAVRFYFTLDEGVDINSFTFSQGTLGTKSGMHYVEVDGINPQDVANQIELTVTSTAGSGSVAISYSPLNYIVRMSANSSSDSLKGLVQALYGYHEEAKYYDSVVPVGSLQANVNGHGAYNNGIYFSTQETNDAPYGDWNTYYDTANEDCLKLVRNGQIISVGLTGRNTICKFGANDYALRLENHTIGEYAPYTTDDMFIVEGAYTHANSGTTLYIAKTYIYYDGAKWVFSDTEPVYEPETESPFTFDKGVFSADIFNNRNNGPTVSVENKQLKLQLPAGAPNWLWIKQDMKAGTVITMDVTFSGEGMNIYGYGSKANGDPITSGAVTEPAAWYSGQGGNANGSYTFTIYEDCYGLSLMLGFAGSTETAIYIDNVVITAPAPSTSYDVGVLQANVNGHGAYNNGIYFSTQETNDAPYGDWNTYYDTANEDCLKLIRNGQIISVGLTGRNTICKFSANDYALRLENHTIGEYAPFTTDDIFIVEGAFTHVNSKTTLNIAKTYIYYDGSNWVFSATEPVFEPETESPFTFDKGVFSADIFNNRNNGLSVSVENKQLKLQQPAGASNWLWLRQNMKAGTVVTMDVTLSGEGMNIFAYGANGNGDPITEGTVTDSVPQSWFWGQGGSESGSYTFTIYEDCYGLALMLGFAGSTETAIYIDNVVIKLPAETQSPFTFDGGSYSADIFNNRNGGLSVSVENKQLKLQQPAGASNWLWLNKELKAGTVITMDVTFSAEGMNIFGYGAKANGDPITEGTVTESVPQGWFWGQGGSTNGSYTFTIYEDCYGLSLMLGFAGSTETAIYIDNVVITEPIETDFGTVILPTSTDTLNIGVWNGSQHAFANEQLKQLQAAGITKITGVNTAHIGTDNVSAWLDRVYSYGIRVIIDLRGWDGATVPSYANHPGLIGFLMYDEPNANVFDDLAALKAKFDAVMPADKLFYVNLFPECAADSSLGETNWWDQLVGNNLDYDEDYVTEFLNKLDIEVLSWDNYSLLEGSGIRTEYFHNFEVMAGKKLPLWYTMLSAGHNATYATPTADELRWQMAVAMTYGVQNIDHYVYSSHEDGYSCMFDLNTQNVTDLYYDIKDVDNEYLAWDNIYMAYKWQGVGAYDAGTSNAMLTMLENKLNLTNYGLTVTSSNEDLLVGVFDHNGNKAYMITNAGSAGSSKVGDGKSFTTADATVTVKLAEGSYKCAAVIDNGEISFVAVNADNTVTLSVEAYEGVFIIPVLN